MYKPVAMYSGAAYPYVPITCVERCVSPFIGPRLANPKSAIFALKSCKKNKQNWNKSSLMTAY